MSRSKFMKVLGLEEFGLRSVRQLEGLGSTTVRVDVYRTSPPLRAMIPLSPNERRRAVASTYREGLRRLLAHAPGAKQIARGKLMIRAETLTRLPRVEGIGPLVLRAIAGRKRRNQEAYRWRPGTYAVRVRMREEIAGKARGVQHLDVRTVIVRAGSPEAARSKVRRHFARPGYQLPYVDPTGNPVRWRVEKIETARGVVLDPLRDGVTTVWTEGMRRKIRPGSGWRP